MSNLFRNFLKRWFKPVAQGVGISKTMPGTRETAGFTYEVGHLAHAIPYDENLLEQARVQWQFGDWESLAKLERDILQHHPDRAKLALLAAAGHIQQGNAQSARQFTQLAQEWGCSKKLISQILIAGVHNSLGCAAAVNRDGQRALRHFEFALDAGAPAGEIRLLTQARLGEQLGRLGLSTGSLQPPSGQPIDVVPRVSAFSLPHRQHAFAVTALAKQALGDAWTANTVISGRPGILTSGNYQYTAFYVDEHTLRLVQRDLLDGDIRSHDLHGDYSLCGAYSSSLGIDRSGHLHICYGHYATQLRYRRAVIPYNIGQWSDELPMIDGDKEWEVCPCFILPQASHPLRLFYCGGDYIRFKTYDEADQTWGNQQDFVFSGIKQKNMPGNAYGNPPVPGSDGSLHRVFVWRTPILSEEEGISNITICYAHSLDSGLTWAVAYSRPYQLPIPQMKEVPSVLSSSDLIDQVDMALDSCNRPHIVFYSEDLSGIPQYQHLWFDGIIWRHYCISQRKTAFFLDGNTLQVSLSRPQIVLDRQDNVYVIYRDDLTDYRLAVTYLPAPDYFCNPTQVCIVWEAECGFAEPVIDRIRWQNENVLTLLVQNNPQPVHELQNALPTTPVWLIDLRFY
ncbi:MAG: BNR-4 repeat-containing protein [Methylobacter sp.]|nr:BNR-4 repeat-containing protein [Methylobacter sp.]